MLKKLCFVSLLLGSVMQLYSQEEAAYIQSIKGTDLSFEMIHVPGGTFQMGDASGASDEQPVHTVELDPFWIGKHEVTWDLFEPFLYKDYEQSLNQQPLDDEVDAVTRPSKPYLDMTFGMGKKGYPALAMTQYAAIQFCKWLYIRTGTFYRLPTEAEWEYACRAGSQQAYGFGADSTQLADYAWYAGNSEEKTHPVGKKQPNAWGIYDMHGNVAEWTYDQYKEDYSGVSGTVKNPVVEPDQLYPHVLRGGSYMDDANTLRSAARMPSDPQWKAIDPQIPKSNWWFPDAPFIGIRLVKPVKQPDVQAALAYYDKAPIEDY